MRRSDGASRSRWNIGSGGTMASTDGYSIRPCRCWRWMARWPAISDRASTSPSANRRKNRCAGRSRSSGKRSGSRPLAAGNGTRPRTKSSGRMSSFALPDSSPARPLPLPAIIRTCTRRNTGNGFRRCADEAIRSGTPYELDVEMISGGSRKWVTARGEAQRDADGRIFGLRGTVQDITERKQREQSLDLVPQPDRPLQRFARDHRRPDTAIPRRERQGLS